MLGRDSLSELGVLHEEGADAFALDNITDRVRAVTRGDHHYIRQEESTRGERKAGESEEEREITGRDAVVDGGESGVDLGLHATTTNLEKN